MKDLIKIITNRKDNNKIENINGNLLYNKLVWEIDIEMKEIIKKKSLERFIKLYKDREIIDYLNDKAEEIIERLKKQGFVYNMDDTTNKPHVLSLSNRLIIGLGNPSPAETGFLLHHIYGIPYIPGSALKGIARWVAIIEIAEKIVEKNGEIYKYIARKNNQEKADIYNVFGEVDKLISMKGFEELEKEDELKEWDSVLEKIKTARKIFGSQDNAGKVTFFDAFPVGNVKFVMDIMNPHYQKYYSGNEPPADWQNPVPIPFLTVEKTSFRFIVFTYKSYENADELIKKAWGYLIKALTSYGVGAKTAVGYGYFEKKTNTNKYVDKTNKKGHNKSINICNQDTDECLKQLLEVYKSGNKHEKISDSMSKIAGVLYQNLDKLADEKKTERAKLLKEVYVTLHKWKNDEIKDRQVKKIEHIKQILGEQQ